MNKLQSIEYFHAFDIHSNSFVPFYLFTNVVQYFLLPFIIKYEKLSLILGNTLYALGTAMYFTVTISGYFCKLFFLFIINYLKFTQHCHL